MPSQLQIPPASYDDLPELAQIHVTSWKQTYVGQVPQAYLDNLDVARRLRLLQEQFPIATALACLSRSLVQHHSPQ